MSLADEVDKDHEHARTLTKIERSFGERIDVYEWEEQVVELLRQLTPRWVGEPFRQRG